VSKPSVDSVITWFDGAAFEDTTDNLTFVTIVEQHEGKLEEKFYSTFYRLNDTVRLVSILIDLKSIRFSMLIQRI